jgi:hypothetical protein
MYERLMRRIVEAERKNQESDDCHGLKQRESVTMRSMFQMFEWWSEL